MKLPKDNAERWALYQEIEQQCLLSRSTRSSQYATNEAYYLFGTNSGNASAYNKIRSTVEVLSSFLFAADSTTFSVGLSADAPEEEANKIEEAAKLLNERWLKSCSDMVFAQTVLWAEVYGAMFVKVLPGGDNGIKTYCVSPHQFGVYREDIMSLDEQEAFVHVYTTTKPDLERTLKDHPRAKEILETLSPNAEPIDRKPDGLSRIIMTSQASAGSALTTLTGIVPDPLAGPGITYTPELPNEMFELRELYVWDDEESDYRIVTKTETRVIYDRLLGSGLMGIRGEPPFAIVCPNPKHDYFWGISDVAALIGLQDWLNKRMDEFANLLAKQVNPPKVVTGMTGITDERMSAMDMIGGWFATAEPGAKVENLPPQIPGELFKSFDMIDIAFAEAAGLPNVLMGKGESGVRSKGHAAEMARIASSRTKRKALVVEDSLEKVGEMSLALLRKYDDTTLKFSLHGKSESFILSQMTDRTFVRVDAHGHSPLFAEDIRESAAFMLEHHIIDRETYVDIVKPPMMDLIKLRLRSIEEKESKAAEQHHEEKIAQKTGVAKPKLVG